MEEMFMYFTVYWGGRCRYQYDIENFEQKLYVLGNKKEASSNYRYVILIRNNTRAASLAGSSGDFGRNLNADLTSNLTYLRGAMSREPIRVVFPRQSERSPSQ